MTKTCAITGSSGYVGGCVKNYFAARGWETFELTRRPTGKSRGIRFQLGEDISPGLLAGIDAFVHCAYDFKPLTWGEIRAVNIEGSRKALEAARAAGIPKIVLISTISAFDGCKSLYGRAKLEIEKIARDNGAMVIRPGLVYGSGTAENSPPSLPRSGGESPSLAGAGEGGRRPDEGSRAKNKLCGLREVVSGIQGEAPKKEMGSSGGMFGKLVEQVRKSSVIPMIGSGSQIQFLVQNEDLCGFIERYANGEIAASQLPDSRILTAANEQPWTFKKLLQEIARGLNKKPKFIPLPWRFIWLGIKSAELAGLRLNFRSDSLISLMNPNPSPDFSSNAKAGLVCRPFDIKALEL